MRRTFSRSRKMHTARIRVHSLRQPTGKGKQQWRIGRMIGCFFVLVCLFSSLQLAKREEPEQAPPQIVVQSVPITVWDHTKQKLETMDLETYTLAVLAGEMPASYDLEALKAQAVAARTYAYGKLCGKKCNRHGADVCTDSGHCQAYSDQTARAKKWGSNAAKNEQKLTKAVSETAGLVILYNGKPIDALFHSTSGGQTEDVENVYSQALPYLRSVQSTGEESAPRYQRTMQFSKKAFVQKLKAENAKVNCTEKNLAKSIGQPKRYASGRVESIVIGKQTFTGKQMRALFALDSTNFTIQVTGDNVLIHTKGFGHGVGMSQVGANAMAKEKHGFEEILHHYYTGVTITSIQNL